MLKTNIPDIFNHSSINPDLMMGFDNWALIDKINKFFANKYTWEFGGGTIILTECLLESDPNKHITVPYTVPGTGVLVRGLAYKCFKDKTFKSVTIPIGCRVDPHSFNGFTGAV